MDKVSVVVTGEPSQELLSSLSLNSDSILEVVVPRNFKGDFSPAPLKRVDVEGLEGGALLNALVKEASADYLLILRPGVSFEEEFIPELLDEVAENPADVVFTNLIVRTGEGEEIKNFQQVYGRELSLVASLSLEDWLPDQALLFRKEALIEGALFDENLLDYEIYDFFYRNLRWLKIRLSELSYVTYSVTEPFIDTAWRSFVLRKKVLTGYDWEKELFPFLSWREKPEVAYATALTIIGKRLVGYFDCFNGSSFLRQALLKFHNQETLKELVNALVNMGLFEEARKLLSPVHGVRGRELEEQIDRLEKIETLVTELESAVKEGKVEEVLYAISEVAGVYQGAPIHNLLGFIYWVGGLKEDAYRFFYKAVTINPVNEDFLSNLLLAAGELKREERVKNLVRILVGENGG